MFVAFTIRLEAIASRMEAIAFRLEVPFFVASHFRRLPFLHPRHAGYARILVEAQPFARSLLSSELNMCAKDIKIRAWAHPVQTHTHTHTCILVFKCNSEVAEVNLLENVVGHKS